jgi:hypothetical protein
VRTIQRSSAAAILTMSLLSAALSYGDEPSAHHFDIGAQSLSSALNEFARQSQQQILFAPDIVAQELSSAVRGDMQSLAALKLLLKDSGLTFTTTADGTILVGNQRGPQTVSNKATASLPRPIAAPHEEVDTITVEVARDREKSLRRQVRNYVSLITAPPHGEHLARWTRDAPLCPLVAGLPSDDGELVLDRLLQIAASSGVPMAPEYCTPNLRVTVTSQPDELLKTWIKRDPWMFDSQIDEGGRKIHDFLHASTPVRSWYNVAFKGFGAFEYIPGTPVASLPGTTGPGVGIHRDLWSVIVVVDARPAQQVSIDQLAAYIAMVGLAQIRMDAKLDDAPTILQLFSNSKKAPPGLSPWDRAYLKGLYSTERSDVTQQLAIASSVAHEVAP